MMAQLYRETASLRSYVARTVGWDYAQDIRHEAFLVTLASINAGTLRDPGAAMGYLRKTAFRMAIHEMDRRKRLSFTGSGCCDHEGCVGADAETRLVRNETNAAIERALEAMPLPGREILRRFYVAEESASDIQLAMCLSPKRYQLAKSRALAKFSAKCRAVLGIKKPRAVKGKKKA